MSSRRSSRKRLREGEEEETGAASQSKPKVVSSAAALKAVAEAAAAEPEVEAPKKKKKKAEPKPTPVLAPEEAARLADFESKAGEFQFYDNGGWNPFSASAQQTLRTAVVEKDKQVVLEPVDAPKKKKSERRIRFVGASTADGVICFILKTAYFKKMRVLE